MKIHPEGVEVLKYLGTALLLVLLFVLRFSDILPRAYESLIERGIARYPEPRRKRRKRFAVSKQQLRKQKIAFWCFLSFICAFAILEWFIVPEPYAIPGDRLAPLGAGIFSAGLLVIFLGPIRDDRGINWTRWTFWATVVSTSAVIWVIGLVLKPSSPNGIMAVLVLGFIPFVWTSGFFRQVERAETELGELNFTKSYDGASAKSKTSTEPADRSPHGQ